MTVADASEACRATTGPRRAGPLLSVIFVALAIGIGIAGYLGGYRLVVLDHGERIVVASFREPAAVAIADELVVDGRNGTPTINSVLEVEAGPTGAPLATTIEPAGASGSPGLRPLTTDQLVVRRVLPRWIAAVRNPLTLFAWVALSLAILVVAVRLLARIWDPTPRPSTKRGGASSRSRASARTHAVPVMVAVVAILTTGVASALFTGTDTVVNNQFGTGCFDAQVSQVQTGQVTNTAEGTQAVALASVDPTRSVAFISVRSDSGRPADSMILADLASATQLDLIRHSDAPGPPAITVDWTVVEFGCGVQVQRGVTAGNGAATLDLAIAAVDPAATFVVTSGVSDRADGSHDGDDDHLAALTGATTLRISAPAGGTLPTDHQYGWQVIGYDDPGDALVQVANRTLSATNSETITLATPVDPETTLILANAASAGAGADIGERLARVHLSSPTTVEVTRLLAGDPLEVAVQVISFTDGTVVQHGVVNLAPAQSVATVAVNPVDTGRAAALSTVAGPGSFSGGASSMASAPVLGEASATFTVTDPTTVTITRDATTATASFGWQLVEWGGPQWWDADYPFRQRIDVATSTTAAPGAYSVPVTIDHQSLVGSGLARADGDDLRVLRWDGSTWSELDRVLADGDAWNSSTTTFWFRTTDPIAAGSTDSYWLYYGDPTPAGPRDDPEAVWLLHEDFESGTLGDFEDRTGGTAWYRAEAWMARIPLTVQAAQVDADLANFPVYVELTDAALGSGAQADGSDIRFTAADGFTALDHEIETWTPGTGALTAWVRLPVVSASTNTTFHLHYGATDAPSRQNPTEVWRNVEGVWHLHRDPSGAAPQLDDSSRARRDGLGTGAMTPSDLVAGRSGTSIDLDGVDDRLDAESFELVGKTLTVSGWVRLDTVTGDQLLVGKSKSATDRIVTLGTTGSQARFELRLGATTHTVTGGTVTAGAWYHLAATWNGSTMELYVDGVSVATASASGTPDTDSTMPISVGAMPSGERRLDGRVDEIRVENTARSDPWLLASVRNQSTPATFLTAAATQSGTWFDQGTWSYRKPLTVSGAAVASNLTDQPVLVDFVDPELLGDLQADGDDVVFTAADGVTRLDHQLEALDLGAGGITAWVAIPTLSAGADTELFVYYGNPTAVDQQDGEGLFGPDADLVFHGS